MSDLSIINKNFLRNDLSEIKVGDIIEVVTKNLNRTNHFKGTVIGEKNKNSISYTFTVLKESNKVAVTSVFSYHSPFIISIKRLGSANNLKVRRAKLNFLERKLAKKKDNG